MKKMLTLALSAAMLLALCACGGQKPAADSAQEAAPQTQAQPQSGPQAEAEQSAAEWTRAGFF